MYMTLRGDGQPLVEKWKLATNQVDLAVGSLVRLGGLLQTTGISLDDLPEVYHLDSE